MVGRDTYDPYCVFGNQVAMDHHQVDNLRAYCEQYPRPLYVCTMKKTHVVKKRGKMVNSSPSSVVFLTSVVFLMSASSP